VEVGRLTPSNQVVEELLFVVCIQVNIIDEQEIFIKILCQRRRYIMSQGDNMTDPSLRYLSLLLCGHGLLQSGKVAGERLGAGSHKDGHSDGDKELLCVSWGLSNTNDTGGHASSVHQVGFNDPEAPPAAVQTRREDHGHVTPLKQMVENAGINLEHLPPNRFLGGDVHGKAIMVVAGTVATEMVPWWPHVGYLITVGSSLLTC
jgi:hypothetical protein